MSPTHEPTVWILTDSRYLEQRMPGALVDWLAARGARHRVVAADRLVAELTPAGGPEADPWLGLRESDVVVARTRNRLALALLHEAPVRADAVLPSPAAIARTRNKPRALQILARAGVPMPRTFLADSPRELERLPRRCFPLLLKPHLGDNGSGIVLVHGPDELDDVPWTDGVALAQSFVDVGGVDLKLYAVGDDVWAVQRPSPLRVGGEAGRGPASAERVPLAPELRRLALACGRALGLELYGVDVIASPSGPLVVDVNEFPNYTAVAEAPEAIGRLVLERSPVAVAA